MRTFPGIKSGENPFEIFTSRNQRDSGDKVTSKPHGETHSHSLVKYRAALNRLGPSLRSPASL